LEKSDLLMKRVEMRMNQELGKKLLSILKEEQVKKDEPMKSHTTFRVGGPADYFVTPQTAEEVAKVIETCTQEKVPYYIVGNGSNLLVSDKGYEGVIIQIYKQMNQVKVEGAQIHAQAGALLSMIAKRALDAELTGFEFAAGIPGTLGGACVMNAGAYGGEMKDVLKSVTVLTDKGEVKTLAKEELELGYRTSVIAKKGYIVLEAVLELQKGEKEKIQAVMDDLKERRVTKQPLEYPSAGSTFKRPEGYFAGKLIQDAGLRGFQVGGAQVSEKHCGFVINKDQATASDVMNLMNQVSDKVYEEFGVRLQPEVKRLGEF
jgi:UDP-N-acetylmuramate dehydrogenase